VVGAESLQLNVGFWTKLFYLPYELLLPFSLSSMALHQQPQITSARLAFRTLLISIASSPFVIAVFTLLVTLDASADAGFLATLATILGLAPLLGVAGLVGLLLVSFPLILFGGTVAFAADYLVCRRYRRELDTVNYQQQFNAQTLSLRQRITLGWQRFTARLSRRKALQHYTDVTLKEEFERYRSPVSERLAKISEQISAYEVRFGHTSHSQQWDSLLNQLRGQLLLIEQKTLRFHELLKERLQVEELTFYRYSAAVKNVYYGVMEHLDKTSKRLSLYITTNNPDTTSLAKEAQLPINERAIESIDELVVAIQSLPRLRAKNNASLNQAMVELEAMLARVGDYRD